MLGTLATGSVTGTLLGPLLGGVTASIFGYQPFHYWYDFITRFVLSLVFVHEEFVPIEKIKPHLGNKF